MLGFIDLFMTLHSSVLFIVHQRKNLNKKEVIRYQSVEQKLEEEIKDFESGKTYSAKEVRESLSKKIDRKTTNIMYQPYINMVVFHFQGFDFRIFYKLEYYENKFCK